MRALRRHVLALGIGAGLTLLVILAALILFGGGRRGIDQPLDTETAASALILSESPIPTGTPTPTATVTPSPRPSRTPTPTPSPIPTTTPSSLPYSFGFTVNAEQLHIYAGPGESYEVLGIVRRGDRLLAVGRLDNGSWWQVDFFGLKGWVPAQPAGPEVNPAALPVVTPPVLPTATSSPTSYAPMPPSLHLAFVLGDVGGADVWVINADGSNLHLLVGGNGDQSEPDWSPGGQHITYQSNQVGNYDIWVIDADGRNAQPLTNTSVDEREPDWSPDGRQIAYRRGGERNEDGELWVMDADGGNQHPLDGGRITGRSPVWSPDGQQMAFMSNRRGTWDVYLFDLNNGEVHRLTDCTTHCRFPAWSPDGQHIAYNVSESASDFTPIQVWRVRADGSESPQLLIEGNRPGRPAWSAEGLIAFNTQDSIEIMNADGGGRHKLPNSDEGWAPDWSR